MPRSNVMGTRDVRGMMADEVPREYVRRIPSTPILSVDYNSLVAELWASLKDAHARIDELEHAMQRLDASSGATSESCSEIPTSIPSTEGSPQSCSLEF